MKPPAVDPLPVLLPAVAGWSSRLPAEVLTDLAPERLGGSGKLHARAA